MSITPKTLQIETASLQEAVNEVRDLLRQAQTDAVLTARKDYTAAELRAMDDLALQQVYGRTFAKGFTAYSEQAAERAAAAERLGGRLFSLKQIQAGFL